MLKHIGVIDYGMLIVGGQNMQTLMGLCDEYIELKEEEAEYRTFAHEKKVLLGEEMRKRNIDVIARKNMLIMLWSGPTPGVRLDRLVRLGDSTYFEGMPGEDLIPLVDEVLPADDRGDRVEKRKQDIGKRIIEIAVRLDGGGHIWGSFVYKGHYFVWDNSRKSIYTREVTDLDG